VRKTDAAVRPHLPKRRKHVSDLKTEGRLDRIRGRVREIWGDITDDDFDRAQGNLENLVGRIRERTGEATDDIRRKLQDLFDRDDNQEARGS
jgi:uncharacterized protein YjbJ (UPF0337 family)